MSLFRIAGFGLGLLSLGVVGVVGVAACAKGPEMQPLIGMANPASANCVKLGGRLEIRRGADGDSGYCYLPDGRVVEEWALFRAGSAPGR